MNFANQALFPNGLKYIKYIDNHTFMIISLPVSLPVIRRFFQELFRLLISLV